jgi:hypothetical protein
MAGMDPAKTPVKQRSYSMRGTQVDQVAPIDLAPQQGLRSLEYLPIHCSPGAAKQKLRFASNAARNHARMANARRA